MDLDNRSQRDTNDAARKLATEMEDLLQRVDALPTVDSRPENEILGYAEDGVPT
jgi:hypothetical protein